MPTIEENLTKNYNVFTCTNYLKMCILHILLATDSSEPGYSKLIFIPYLLYNVLISDSHNYYYFVRDVPMNIHVHFGLNHVSSFKEYAISNE